MGRRGRMTQGLLMILSVFLPACTVVYLPEDTRAVRMETVNAGGASCRGEGRKGRIYYWRRTPDVIAVRKNAFPLVVTCEKQGFRKTVSIVDGKTGPRQPASGLKEAARKAVNFLTGTFRDERVESSDEPLHVKISMEPEESSPDGTRRYPTKTLAK